MPLKYAKLLVNLRNAVFALCGRGADAAPLFECLRDEAIACFEAAGITYLRPRELERRHAGVLEMREVPGGVRGGGSTWQSLARGTGTSEVDYLNGEITLLGRLHGVPTPCNRMIQELAIAAARERRPPASMTPEEVLARVRVLE
jgi:2-dehydropantoate 2-reductase